MVRILLVNLVIVLEVEDIFTWGDPSQVCGKSKITTAEECEAAAEYNRKTNI